MIYPWLYLFLFLAAGIITGFYTDFYLPLYIPAFLLTVAFFIPNGTVSYLTLGLASFLLGISVSYKEPVEIQSKTGFVECVSLSATSGGFDCKVINSDINLLKGKTIRVYSDSQDVFLFSKVAFIGRVESFKNQIKAFPKKEFIKVKNDGNPFYVIKSFKDRLIKNYRYTALNRETFNLGLGLVFGERGEISQSDYTSFVKSGLAHFLAISGSHIAILMVVLTYTLFFVPVTVRYILMIFLIPLYAVFTGLAVPVVRASLMAVFYSVSKLKYFKFNSVNVLFLVGYIYLLIFPDSLFSASFQLSFVAVLGIILGLEIFRQYSTFIKIVATSFMATLFTAPVVMYHFGNVSLNSIISTPVATLPLYPYLFFAFINMFTGFSIEPFVRLMDSFGSLFLLTVRLFEGLPFYFTGFKPSIFVILLFYVFLIVLIFCGLSIQKKVVAMMLSFVVFSAAAKSEKKSFTVYSFQGRDYPALFVISGKRCYLVSDFPVYRQLSIFDKEGCQQRFLVTEKPEKFTDDYLSGFNRVYPYQYEVTTPDFVIKKWIEYRLYRNSKEYIIKNQDGELSFE